MNSHLISKKVVLITGCSSGLGLSLAHLLYNSRAYRVVVTARAASIANLRIQFNESERFLIRELDVTSTQQIHQVVNEICCLWGAIDILVNNAGVCFRSVVEHMDVDSEMMQLKTNYLGPMTLIRSLLPVMRERTSGQIINISSASGIVAMPTMASYSASKHALEGATEALWYEARPYGIKVTLVQPGFIRSDSFSHVVLSKKAQMSTMLSGPHSEYYSSMAPVVEKYMALSVVNHDDIAKKVIGLFESKDPPLRLSVTPDVIVFKWLRWLLPAWLFHRLIFALLPGSKSWGPSTSKAA
jgi:hypothetical protein